jgi:hypothetical protein
MKPWLRSLPAQGERQMTCLRPAISLYSRPYHIDSSSGLLKPLRETKLAEIQSQLLEDCYYIFEERLPQHFGDRIAERIADCGFIVRDDAIPYDPTKLHKYDRNAPIAHNYMLPNDDITDVPEVQELVSDATLIKVAQRYLNAKSKGSGSIGALLTIRLSKSSMAASTWNSSATNVSNGVAEHEVWVPRKMLEAKGVKSTKVDL